MRTLLSLVAICALALLVASCATYRPAPLNTPAIRLTSPQERIYGQTVTLTVQFPAGEYQPSFADEDGVYYRAPSPLVLENALAGNGKGEAKGGLFIPYAGSRDQRQTGWRESDDNGAALRSGGMVGIELFRISSPVDYATAVPSSKPSSGLTTEGGAKLAYRD